MPIQVPKTNVSKPLPEPRPRKHIIHSPRPIPLRRTKKAVSSLRIETNIIKNYIFKDERNLFRLKKVSNQRQNN